MDKEMYRTLVDCKAFASRHCRLGFYAEFHYTSLTPIGNYQDRFLGKISKKIEKVQKMAGKRAARSAPLC